MDKTEIRAVNKYLNIEGMNTKELHDDMVKKLCEDSPSYFTVKKWVADFKLGIESTDDAPRSSHPKSATTDHQTEEIHHMVTNDRHVTVQQIADTIGIPS